MGQSVGAELRPRGPLAAAAAAALHQEPGRLPEWEIIGRGGAQAVGLDLHGH